MALKAKIDKAAYDALPDVLKAEYKEASDKMGYLLDAEGVEDIGALRRAKDREAEERVKEKKRADDAEASLRTLNEAAGGDALAAARKAGDIATLETSWKKKRDDDVAVVTGQLTKREAALRKKFVDDAATALVTRISTTPGVLLPHVLSRIDVDMSGDEPITRVLDKSGKPSAASLDDLEKEIVANPDFAAIIIASQGSGGGANGGKQNGGGSTKKFAEMNSTERGEYLKRDPVGFEKDAEAARKVGPRL